MNFSVHHSAFLFGQSDGDPNEAWPEFYMNNHEQYSMHSQYLQQPPFKRQRNSENDQSDVVVPLNSRMPPPNLPVNKGTNNIFYKTRICAKFRLGTCRNGENCNFAHGAEDMRQPPPNWQELIGLRVEEERPPANWVEDQKIIHKMKLCKKYYIGEECPYGDRCSFLHEDPAKFRDGSGRFRENSVISIGPNIPPMTYADGSNHNNVINFNFENDKSVNVINSNSDGRVIAKPTPSWKTKLCIKWETRQCPYGEKCHFAHGQAELQFPGGRVEAEVGGASSVPILTKTVSKMVNDASIAHASSLSAPNEEDQSNKCLLKWKGPKKINRIYADWLDDLPLQNFESKLER